MLVMKGYKTKIPLFIFGVLPNNFNDWMIFTYKYLKNFPTYYLSFTTLKHKYTSFS